MSIFAIDPDIRRAKTLSAEFYTDQKYFELSKERIFARCWHFLGSDDRADDLQPFTLLPGFLDEPILITTTVDGTRCLSNVCTHRGKILVEQACDANLIRCDYHGRRFSLDGRLLSMPEFEGVEDFPAESDNLFQLPVERRGGFRFTSPDPIAAFATFTGGTDLEFDTIDAGNLHLRSSREYEVDAHWALYCENYLEGFHIPYVHQSLNAVVDYGSYSTEVFRYSSLQTAYDANASIAARYLFIFPNLMFNFYPWGVSVNVVRPVRPDKSVVEFYTYVGDETQVETGAGADLHLVEMEDEAVVESVQKGVRSRFYSQGRYSPMREQGTHHFHRLIAEFMG
ncbi:MAG: SRPBCC family protein [Pyrinomonadaceae bacterium]